VCLSFLYSLAQALRRRREERGGNGVKGLSGSEANLLDRKKVGEHLEAEIDRKMSSRAKRGDLTRRVIPSEVRHLRVLHDNYEIATTSSMSRDDFVGLPRLLRGLA
jgi:hypothetical protein